MKKLIFNVTQKKIKKIELKCSFKTIINYSCGPTVYNDIHIGNLRSILFPKLLLNFINITKHKKIIHIQNFTDIDQKIIDKSKKQKISISQLTNTYITKCINIMKIFNVYTISNIESHYPKTTDYITKIQNIILHLINNKKAYINDKGIYLSLENEQFMLSNRSANIKEDDFCLWKFRKKDQISWPFLNKRGIPGWHIECVAMSSSILKKYQKKNISIYFGGQDLIFPHHENTNILFKYLKQPINVTYWLHNGMITLDNSKMSKSKNNIILVKDLLKKFNADCIKIFLLSNSYYKDIKFTITELENYKKILQTIKNYYFQYQKKDFFNTKNIKNNIYKKDIIDILSNNFNVQGVIGYIIKNINNKNKNLSFLQSIFFFFVKILRCKIFDILKKEI